MNELSTIIELSKKGVIEHAEKQADQILEGEYSNPLDALILINKLELFSKTLKAKVSKGAISEAMKFSKTELKDYRGVSLQIAESGVKYDYSQDLKWTELNERLSEIKAIIKERETFLKTVKDIDSIVDGETGEYITPPTKTSTTTVKVTLK